jgi:HAMP domain-containing protein
MLAIIGGVVTAGWIARPLGVLAEAARRIRRGNLDVPRLPTTRDEIGTLGRAMGDMVQALRDREFVRGVLGRFVNRSSRSACSSIGRRSGSGASCATSPCSSPTSGDFRRCRSTSAPRPSFSS